MSSEDVALVIRPVKKPWAGWVLSFRQTAEHGYESLPDEMATKLLADSRSVR